MSSAQKVAQAMWREDEASRAPGMKIEVIGPGHATLSMTVMSRMANGQALSASAFIDYLAPAHVRDRLTAHAREVERRERRGIYDVTVLPP